MKDGEDAGLEIITGDSTYCSVTIPDDCIALQIGECLQIHSGGRLLATPHI